MSISEAQIYRSWSQPYGKPVSRRPDLADEHTQLLTQVAIRAEATLAVAAAGRSPDTELHALLGYLRAEILRQASDEEMLLFPRRGTSGGLRRLARDHARLRAGVEALEQAVCGDEQSWARLASTVRGLLEQLERHLTAEEAILAASGRPGGLPATTALGMHPHEWYPLTEGPVIDLDALPADEAAEAAAGRLLRLSQGERVELHSATDPYPVWQRVDDLASGDYGFCYLEDGPDRWRVEVTRRPSA